MNIHTKGVPIYLTVEELSKVLHISRTKAYELVRAGTIRSIRIGAQYRIPADALKELEDRGS